MKTIIAATDFSAAATNAVNYAADMAAATGAALLLLHTFEIPVSYTEVPLAFNAQEIATEASAALNRLKEDLIRTKHSSLNIETTVRQGDFYHELKSVCDNIKPYAVVLGSKGMTFAERLLFGSHTIRTMKHLPWPLITVPLDATFSSIKKIALACDFSDLAETFPLDEIKMLITDFNAALHVVNTGKENSFDPDMVFQSAVLREMLGSIKHEFHFLTSDEADEAVLEFAEKNNIDLLIVLPKRHSLLDKIIHRSYAKQLILHSSLPVMALHV